MSYNHEETDPFIAHFFPHGYDAYFTSQRRPKAAWSSGEFVNYHNTTRKFIRRIRHNGRIEQVLMDPLDSGGMLCNGCQQLLGPVGSLPKSGPCFVEGCPKFQMNDYDAVSLDDTSQTTVASTAESIATIASTTGGSAGGEDAVTPPGRTPADDIDWDSFTPSPRASQEPVFRPPLYPQPENASEGGWPAKYITRQANVVVTHPVAFEPPHYRYQKFPRNGLVPWRADRQEDLDNLERRRTRYKKWETKSWFQARDERIRKTGGREYPEIGWNA